MMERVWTQVVYMYRCFPRQTFWLYIEICVDMVSFDMVSLNMQCQCAIQACIHACWNAGEMDSSHTVTVQVVAYSLIHALLMWGINRSFAWWSLSFFLIYRWINWFKCSSDCGGCSWCHHATNCVLSYHHHYHCCLLCLWVRCLTVKQL